MVETLSNQGLNQFNFKFNIMSNTISNPTQSNNVVFSGKNRFEINRKQKDQDAKDQLDYAYNFFGSVRNKAYKTKNI